MMTYTLLNLAFFSALLILGFLTLRKKFIEPNTKALILTLVVLLICTAIFDSLIILLDIVAYDPSNLLGVYIWAAPIEDFSYAIVAAIGAPILWHNLKENKGTKTNG